MSCPPAVLGPKDRARMRAAAFRARRVLPGPLGELVSRELFAAEEFAYLLGDSSGLPWRLTQFVLDLPDPPKPEPEPPW